MFYCHFQGEDGGDDAADNDSEDEDGFFVPHGYLSEGEGCEDAEEDVSDDDGLYLLASCVFSPDFHGRSVKN